MNRHFSWTAAIFVWGCCLCFAQTLLQSRIFVTPDDGPFDTFSLAGRPPQTLRIVNPYGDVSVQFIPNSGIRSDGFDPNNSITARTFGGLDFVVVVTDHPGQGIEITLQRREGSTSTEGHIDLHIPAELVEHVRLVAPRGDITVRGNESHQFQGGAAFGNRIEAITHYGNIFISNLHSARSHLSILAEAHGQHQQRLLGNVTLSNMSNVQADCFADGEIAFWSLESSALEGNTAGRMTIRGRTGQSQYFAPMAETSIHESLVSASPVVHRQRRVVSPDMPLFCHSVLFETEHALFRFGRWLNTRNY